VGLLGLRAVSAFKMCTEGAVAEVQVQSKCCTYVEIRRFTGWAIRGTARTRMAARQSKSGVGLVKVVEGL